VSGERRTTALGALDGDAGIQNARRAAARRVAEVPLGRERVTDHQPVMWGGAMLFGCW
jgi:hypothetical protein